MKNFFIQNPTHFQIEIKMSIIFYLLFSEKKFCVFNLEAGKSFYILPDFKCA